MRRTSAVHGYVLAVSALGLALCGALLAAGVLRGVVSLEALVFGLFVMLGELLPITVPRQGEQDQITTSTTFALALLMTAGAIPAIVAQALSSVIADMVRRKPLWKAGFNAAQ